MRDEIARGAPSGALFAESLSLALLSYASQRATEAPFEVREGLSAAQRRRLAQYIREHLHEDLSVAELGAQVGLGARRFTTLFRAAFGATPHRYVLRERLNEGARLLARGDQAITDIALQTGFCSHSHFTSTFRAAFGTTPQRYARRPRWNG
jgi:AraC family transcriptional regulator